ncbi:unnamed protein product [Camellia sinensis]
MLYIAEVASFVFMCSSMVFRGQLARSNSFYSSEPPRHDGTDKPSGVGAEKMKPSIHLLANFEGDGDRKSWASFQERIARAPEQVLRYYERAKPLWPISSGRPSKTDITKCSYCGGPQGFEFQILPQLLYYFGPLAREPGTLIIYI